MDLKIDFSEFMGKFQELIEKNFPICKVQVIMNDGSLSFSEMEIKSNQIPLPGDKFYAEPKRYDYNSNSTKVKVLDREISYYESDIYKVILTVEKA